MSCASDIAYPAHLPPPVRWVGRPRDRRAVSAGPGNVQVRVRQRDRVTDIDAEWIYSRAEMADWRGWFDDNLLLGQRWFGCATPGPGGWVDRVMRYRPGSVRLDYLPGGNYRVSAQIEQRGRSVVPQGLQPALPVAASVGAAEVFGSGGRLARDPYTGYLWCTWVSTGGPATPTGGAVPLDGSYVLVYDPVTRALVDALRIGDAGEQGQWILYRAGSVYVGTTGNSYNPSGAAPVVVQFDACGRTVTGSGPTSYAGAVSKLGLLSADASAVYISTVAGVGAGTSLMAPDAPYALLASETASDWLLDAVYQPHTGVRAYMGYGAFVDLRGGGVEMTVSTAGIIDTTHTQRSRMLARAESAHIFVCNCGTAGVARVHTQTGAIQSVSSTMVPRALYYSPDTDRLYVDGADPGGAAATVKAYDGATLALVGEHQAQVAGTGAWSGNSVYLGHETFAAVEFHTMPTARLWRVSFPID